MAQRRTSPITPNGKPPLIVRGERRERPDWDLFVSVLVALALERAAQAAKAKEQDRE
jgi:hypothetical protein